MSEIYRIFANTWHDNLSFDDVALREMYDFESRGIPITTANNGFEVGKKYLNLTVTQWREDIALGLITKHELLSDDLFPHWWLIPILDTFHVV